jgi:hypothetical protein
MLRALSRCVPRWLSPDPGLSSWRTQDGAAGAGVSRSRDVWGRLCVWHVRLDRSAEAVQPSLGDPHSVTQAAAWLTSYTFNAHLYRLPM